MKLGSTLFSARVRRFDSGTAVLAVTTVVMITPVVAPAASHAAPLVPTAAPVLTWGSDDVEAALANGDNPRNKQSLAAGAATPGGKAVGAAPTPFELLQELVQGIARAFEVVIGTTVYIAIAFTGGVITAVGDFLPGPVGDVIASLGNSVTNVANAIAEAIHVGPYSTSVA